MSTNINRRNLSEKSELISDLHEHCISADSREIYLHAAYNIDEETGVDFRMCTRFIKNLNFLQHLSLEKPILIHQMTFGGEWEYGMAMYDAIKACPCPVTVLAYAHARSMSSIIMQSADWRVLMPNCLFMIHEGTMGVEDTTKGFMSVAEQLKVDCETMLQIYIERVKHGSEWEGKTDLWIKRQLQKKMDSKQEWYLTSREAVRYGFADAVFGDDGYDDIKTLLGTT